MRAHSDQTKAAVMAALLTGQSVGQIAKEYNLPESTIRDWKRQSADDPTPKKEIGQLVLEYLQANLEALKAQTIMFRDMTWLAKQNAADIAVLHGVMTDKAIRLLEAMSKGADKPE